MFNLGIHYTFIGKDCERPLLSYIPSHDLSNIWNPGYLEARDRRFSGGRHFIVYLGEYQNDDFLGAMLTHSNRPGSILMMENHFEENKMELFTNFNLTAKLIKFGAGDLLHLWESYQN